MLKLQSQAGRKQALIHGLVTTQAGSHKNKGCGLGRGVCGSLDDESSLCLKCLTLQRLPCAGLQFQHPKAGVLGQPSAEGLCGACCGRLCQSMYMMCCSRGAACMLVASASLDAAHDGMMIAPEGAECLVAMLSGCRDTVYVKRSHRARAVQRGR